MYLWGLGFGLTTEAPLGVAAGHLDLRPPLGLDREGGIAQPVSITSRMQGLFPSALQGLQLV